MFFVVSRDILSVEGFWLILGCRRLHGFRICSRFLSGLGWGFIFTALGFETWGKIGVLCQIWGFAGSVWMISNGFWCKSPTMRCHTVIKFSRRGPPLCCTLTQWFTRRGARETSHRGRSRILARALGREMSWSEGWDSLACGGTYYGCSIEIRTLSCLEGWARGTQETKLAELHRSVQPAAGLLIVALCCIVIALSNFCNPP